MTEESVGEKEGDGLIRFPVLLSAPVPARWLGEAGPRGGRRRRRPELAPTWRDSRAVAGRPAPWRARKEVGRASLGWVQADHAQLLTLLYCQVLALSLRLTGSSRGNCSWGRGACADRRGPGAVLNEAGKP